MSNSISLTVKGSPEYMQVCNSVAIASANIAGLDVDCVDEIGMSVFEGCKIISCHDSDCWCSEYKIDINICENKFQVIITATGDYELEKCKKICTHCPKEGDLSLAIINSVMDEVEFTRNENNKKQLIMSKNI